MTEAKQEQDESNKSTLTEVHWPATSTLRRYPQDIVMIIKNTMTPSIVESCFLLLSHETATSNIKGTEVIHSGHWGDRENTLQNNEFLLFTSDSTKLISKRKVCVDCGYPKASLQDFQKSSLRVSEAEDPAIAVIVRLLQWAATASLWLSFIA